MRGYIWLISLLCFLAFTGNAAEPDTAGILHFDIDNGFPSNNVYSLIQDRLGYLWFATDNGVVKYNGYSFKIFNTSNGLPANDVYQFYEDKRGRIWLNSISYQFGYMKDDKYNETNLKTHDRIFKGYFFMDNGKYMFLMYPEYKTFYLAVLTDDLEFLTPFSFVGENDTARDKTIRHAHIGKTGKLYIETNNYEMFSYDLLHPDKPMRRVCAPMMPYSKNYVGGTKLIDSHDNYYQFRYKGKDVIFYSMSKCATRIFNFSFVPAEYIYTIIPGDITNDRYGYNYVITNYFMYVVDSEFNIVKKESINAVATASSQLAYVFNDRNGDRWYTTNSAGVWCKMNRSGAFRLNSRSAELKGATCVGKSGDGATFWWQKDKAVLYKLYADNRLKTITLPYKTGVTSVADENDSMMYFALNAGIYEYNKYTDEVSDLAKKYRACIALDQLSRPHVINDDTSKAIFMGGHLQITGFDSKRFYAAGIFGLTVFNRSADTLRCYGLTDERLTNVLLDSNDRKIIAYNRQKIVVFDPASEKYVTFAHDYLKTVLGIDDIVNIQIDQYHNVFIQDGGRLLAYNPIVNAMTEMRFEFNMQGARFSIFENKIVIAGAFGVAGMSIRGPLSFGNVNVVPNISSYSRINSSVVNAAGDLLLNTDKGVYKFSHANADTSYRSVYGSGNLFSVILKTPHEKKISNFDTIRIDQNLEKINCDAINYYGKGKTTFNYFISGYSHGWQQTDGELFTGGLEPDKYYRVVCTVSDNVWKSKPLSFYIYKVPYWWQTSNWNIFFWICGVLLAVSLLVAVGLITRKIVAKGNEKRRALTELELRAIYAQINPHFIFNTLNAAQYFINKKRFDDAYAHVSKFSRLLRSYLKSTQDRYIVLDEEIQMLRNYIELQQTRFEEKFEYRLDVENKIPVHNIKIPSLLLQPLVENAINHGLFHKEKDGLLIVKFLQGADNRELICIIEDNGVGRERSGLINKDIVDRKESYGTKLTQQLIQIYREYEHMHIFMEYTDKTEPETGTIVKLTIKNVKYIG